jgi:hypothetical protein
LLLFLGGGILIGASAGGTVGAGTGVEANIDEKIPIYLYR